MLGTFFVSRCLNIYSKNTILSVIVVLISALLVGCGMQQTKKTTPKSTSTSWEFHYGKISQVDGWRLKAKVGFITDTKGSNNVVMDWRQGLGCFRLHLSTPFGQSVAKLIGNQKKVTLIQPNKEPVESNSIDTLVFNKTGLEIPFHYIRYWAVGIPAPKTNYKMTQNGNHQLETLTQDGWTISYSKYSNFNGYAIPTHIKVSSAHVKLKIIIRDWAPVNNTVT